MTRSSVKGFGQEGTSFLLRELRRYWLLATNCASGCLLIRKRSESEENGEEIWTGFLIFPRMADYKKLKVWHYSHLLALDTHRIAMRIRGRDYSSFRNQLIRASASIPANIVEGRAKDTDKDFSRFLGYAAGSASELEYHVTLVRDLGLIPPKDAATLLQQIADVCRMLTAFRTKLKAPDLGK